MLSQEQLENDTTSIYSNAALFELTLNDSTLLAPSRIRFSEVLNQEPILAGQDSHVSPDPDLGNFASGIGHYWHWALLALGIIGIEHYWHWA